jgi:hypothetical protein
MAAPKKVIAAPPPPTATPENPSGLPPPGDAQREAKLKQRDELLRMADQLNSEIEGGTIDPKKLEPINEILGIYDIAMLVSGRLDTHEYCWVHAPIAENAGAKQVVLKKMLGWEVVQGEHPECRDRELMGRDGTTTRRFGDTILMRITKEKYQELWRRDEEKRRRIEKGIDEALMDMGEKYRGKGITVSRTLSTEQLRGAGAQHLAGQKLDQMLREGNMPGLRFQNG